MVSGLLVEIKTSPVIVSQAGNEDVLGNSGVAVGRRSFVSSCEGPVTRMCWWPRKEEGKRK